MRYQVIYNVNTTAIIIKTEVSDGRCSNAGLHKICVGASLNRRYKSGEEQREYPVAATGFAANFTLADLETFRPINNCGNKLTVVKYNTKKLRQ
jgi:hypothetical protein